MTGEDDRERLLGRVRAWFDAPEQVRWYREEAPRGPTPAEARLLAALPPAGRVLDLGCGAGRAAAAFSTLEAGDAFTLGGEGYLHVFTPDRLRRELAASDLAIEGFESDERHGGDGWLRLALLRKAART